MRSGIASPESIGFRDRIRLQDEPSMIDSSQITITVRVFAMVRELLGYAETSIVLASGSTAGDAFGVLEAQEPRLGNLRRSLLLMVNHDYVTMKHPLKDGDELALIPPVSGGAETPAFLVTSDELDPRVIESLVAGPSYGAIATFTGTVRDHARGRSVTALDYEAYVPAAEHQLRVIGEEIASQWPGVRTAIHHRTGYLEPGVASVVIACASAHRGEAFAAASHAIERIKQIVPIWKKEHYADGEVWVGSEAEYQREIRQER